MNNSFWRSGCAPTLFATSLYFNLSFMIWYVLGPLGVQIAGDLQLSTQQCAIMVTTPTLAGAMPRSLFDLLADHWLPKNTGILAQVIVIATLAVAWLLGVDNYAQTLLLGLFLGFAETSFAVTLPFASQWYPPQHQGKTIDVAGAGNSDTVFAALFTPGLAATSDWNNVFDFALLPLLLTLLVFAMVARNAPQRPASKAMGDYLKALGDRDSWWFMFFYGVTFSGLLGLASTLPGYFHDRYGLNPVTAGYYTATYVFAGSLMHPLGGTLTDRIGGIRSLLMVYTLAAICIAMVDFHLPSAMAALGLFMVAMLSLGTNNDTVSQLVPQRFHREIDVVTGLIGVAGGIGGFCLTASLGAIKQSIGNYQLGLQLLASFGVLAWFGLHGAKRRWRTTQDSVAVTAARV